MFSWMFEFQDGTLWPRKLSARRGWCWKNVKKWQKKNQVGKISQSGWSRPARGPEPAPRSVRNKIVAGSSLRAEPNWSRLRAEQAARRAFGGSRAAPRGARGRLRKPIFSTLKKMATKWLNKYCSVQYFLVHMQCMDIQFNWVGCRPCHNNCYPKRSYPIHQLRYYFIGESEGDVCFLKIFWNLYTKKYFTIFVSSEHPKKTANCTEGWKIPRK